MANAKKALNLLEPVTALPGIGEKTAENLSRAGIKTAKDLFYYFPRTYENYQNVMKISDLKPGKVVIRGRVSDVQTKFAKSRHMTITEALISDETDTIRAVWFNQPYREKQFTDAKKQGQEFLFSGNFELKYGRFQLTAPSVAVAKGEASEHKRDDFKRKPDDYWDKQFEDEHKKNAEKQKRNLKVSSEQAAYLPVYPQKSAIKPEAFKKLMEKSKALFAEIPDLLPTSTEIAASTSVSTKDLAKSAQMLYRIKQIPEFVKAGARREALYKIHFPETEAEVDEAKRYLAYEELFELLLASYLNRQENQKLRANALPYLNEETHKLLKSLPFTLTGGQKRAAWDILQDLEKTVPMNRLLQGDVGSGKTVVAAMAAYQAIKNGSQAALLAPTAILAEQHAESLQGLLGPLGVNIGLLTGSTKHKKELKEHIKAGDVNLVIGTHALITDDTEFANLNLCIIDEQHRFGVEQRQKLLLKSPDGTAPHLLSMTATPIPRSLQLTIFGDLTVSTIRELPKGRQPIETKILREIDQKNALYPKVSAEILNGRQVYWICKAIEDNPQQETVSVKKQCEKLKQIFPRFSVAYLHGRMKPAEKDQIMADFQAGKTQILVSTTVVEVGVNVPNASLMVIMDAENYGLAQLHQLRGRVGRGQYQSYCYLIKTGEEPPSRRLKELEKSTDGFHLAEVDLKLRGPGEIYGALQHGALDLKIASLTDTTTISVAQLHVAAFAKNPEFMVKYKELMTNIKRYQQITTLN